MRKLPLTRCLAPALAAAALCLLAAAPARAGSPRTAHTTTLLPTGNVLIAGGVDDAGNVLNSAELVLSAKNGSYIAAPPMAVQRASATATVLATGMVLVAGGIDGTGTVRKDAEIYDPATNTWTCVGGAPNCATNAGMNGARYNHTATLLNTGKVLLCGGQPDTTGASVNASCELFTPSPLPAIGGAFSGAPPSLQQGRALHTATLLKDGKVWFAGGWNPAATATNGWLPTTERYDPVSGSFSSAHPLGSARGVHTATMLGNGKVLVMGGFNAANVLNNFGILDSMEIFDPVANSMTPASSLNTRREMHTALLSADGSVEFQGGLGNITTTYLAPLSAPLVVPGGELTAGFTGFSAAYNGDGVSNILNPAASMGSGDIYLSQPVVGVIRDGEVVFSSPVLNTNVGQALWVPGALGNPAVGLRASLNGFRVDCRQSIASAGLPNNCGHINLAGAQYLNFTQGQAFFVPRRGLTVTGSIIPAGTMFFSHALSAGAPTASLLTSSAVATVTITLDPQLAGAGISSGTYYITGGGYTQQSSFTIVFSGGHFRVPPGTTLDGTGAVTLASVKLEDLVGTANWAGSGPSYVTNTQEPSPEPGTVPTLSSLTGDFNYAASSINVSGLNFTLGISTVVIRSMIFSTPEYYNPQTNSISYAAPGGVAPDVLADAARFGHTETLMPNNDSLMVGGSFCQDAACANIVAKSSAPATLSSKPRWDVRVLPRYYNWGSSGASLAQARLLHSATPLTNGQILIAGGSNGPNILGTAELLDPVANAVSPTNGPMSVVRDMHSATLLPNGRVLLAGGFTTNATSTGSTNAVDVYYPDTKLFLPTAVMISSRSNHTATLMPDGGVMVVGGTGANDIVTASAEVFYSTGLAWFPLPPLQGGGVCDTGSATHPERYLHTATLLKDGRLMVSGGINSQGVLSSVCAYNPATGAWAKLASMPHQLYSHTATLLPDGRVLVVGGNDGFGEFNASYFYDPAADAWSLTDPILLAPLLQPRFGHTATLLPNGTVMISGGANRFGTLANENEIFHVNASSWVAGGVNFSGGARSYHTMTLAPNGYVYAVGGSNGVIGGSGNTLYTAIERAYFTAFPDQYSIGAPPSLRQSTITATVNATVAGTPLQPGQSLTVSGLQFRGGTEASGGGSGAANSSFSFPHLVLQRLDGSGGGSSQSDAGFVVDLTTQIYLNNGNVATLDTSLTVPMPGTPGQLPLGWYNARTGANDVYANGAFVQVGPPKPAAAPATASGTVMGASSITWTWSAVAGASGYDVYQATSGVFLGTAPAIGTPFFYQTNLPPNTTASVSIAGFTASGDGPLLFANTYYTLASTASLVQVSSVGYSSLVLQWNQDGNAPGAIYEVSMSTDWPSPFSQSASTPVPAYADVTTNYALILNLQPATTYSFRLRTFNAALLPSNFSMIVSTLTRTPVTGIGGIAVSPTVIQWQWADPGGVRYYNVYGSTAGNFVSTAATNVFYDAGLGTNTPRSIFVTAVTSAGEGPLAAGPTVYTLTNPPGLVVPFLTNVSTGGLTAAWTSAGNPIGTNYRVVSQVVNSSVTNTTVGFIMAVVGLNPSSFVDVSVMAVNGDGIASAPVEYSTYTLANPPASLAVAQTTPISIMLSWDTQGNSTTTWYEITYSTDNFATNLSTAIAFAAQFNGSTTTVTGLITSTTYWLRVRAQNKLGQTTVFSNTVSTITFNGGVAAGSLGGVLTANGISQIQGSLGNGRSILVTSPGGAFPQSVTLAISSYDATTPLCPNGLNVAFSIAESPAFQPTKPIYFTSSYSPGELGAFAPAQVALMRFEPVSGTCVPLSTAFNTTARTFTAELNHFSIYELAGVPLAADMGFARVFPNPYRVARDGYVTIDKVPPGARVRIMTLRGQPVLDQPANAAGILTWSATNGASRSVASGLYLVLIDYAGAHKTLKLAVIR